VTFHRAVGRHTGSPRNDVLGVEVSVHRSVNPQVGFRFLVGVLNRTFSECAGFARDFAKVEDQVRFLARTLLY
jgi:hypothetical protein